MLTEIAQVTAILNGNIGRRRRGPPVGGIGTFMFTVPWIFCVLTESAASVSVSKLTLAEEFLFPTFFAEMSIPMPRTVMILRARKIILVHCVIGVTSISIVMISSVLTEGAVILMLAEESRIGTLLARHIGNIGTIVPVDCASRGGLAVRVRTAEVFPTGTCLAQCLVVLSTFIPNTQAITVVAVILVRTEELLIVARHLAKKCLQALELTHPFTTQTLKRW